jgi:hypothetical protein
MLTHISLTCMLYLSNTYLHSTKHPHEENYFGSHLVIVKLRGSEVACVGV